MKALATSARWNTDPNKHTHTHTRTYVCTIICVCIGTVRALAASARWNTDPNKHTHTHICVHHHLCLYRYSESTGRKRSLEHKPPHKHTHARTHICSQHHVCMLCSGMMRALAASAHWRRSCLIWRANWSVQRSWSLAWQGSASDGECREGCACGCGCGYVGG